MMHIRFFCLLSALMIWSAPASAYDTPPIEAFFGASNILATTGNGRLTAAVSPEGGLSVLSWPSPSYYDHLSYIASNDLDARNLHRAGALLGMGAYGGIAVDTPQGRTVSWFVDESWDATVEHTADDSLVVRTTYTHEQIPVQVVQHDFVTVDSDALVREYTFTIEQGAPVAGVWLLSYSNLSPNQSKLEQMPIADFAFEQHQDFIAVWDSSAEAIVHFHPAGNGTMESPLGIVQLRDNMRRDFGPIGELLKTDPVDETSLDEAVATLDDDYGAGVYVAQSSIPPADQFQIGEDATDVCAQIDALADNIATQLESGANPGFTIPSNVVGLLRCGTFDPITTPRTENEWVYQAEDALADAADGDLAGSRVAAAQVNSALRVPVTLTDGTGTASIVYAFGADRAEAVSTLDAVRNTTVADLRDAVETESAAWAADLVVPDTLPEGFEAFIRRAFLNLRVGTDADSGAIVASVSRQPSYHVDWPRDGVFFNVALDLAGKHDLVEKRLAFYADVIRDEPESPTLIINTGPPGWPDQPNERDFPAGSWEMNYYADGTPSGNIRLEIDNTALLVWNYAEHAGWIDDESERMAFLQTSWPTVRAAADWLTGWREPETGLIWPSNEDDHIEYTQGMQGNGTAFLALESAAMIATALGEEDAAQRYVTRARELHAAILEHLWDPEAERFFSQPPWSERTVANPTEWIGWPIRVLPWEDPRLRAQVLEMSDRHVASVRGETSRGQYPTKAATSVALMFAGEPEAERGLEIADTLANEIADPRTRMLGEVYVNDDVDGDGEVDRRLNVQGNPHLWSAILVYISARAYATPEDFDRYRDVLPAVDVRTTFPSDAMEPQPDAGPGADAGGDPGADAGGPDVGLGSLGGNSCVCSATPGAGAAQPWLLALLGFVWAARRRRQGSRRRTRPTLEVGAVR